MNHYYETFFKNFFKLFFVLVIVSAFLYILSPFLLPLIFGGMLAMALNPFIVYFMNKKKWTRFKSILTVSLVMLLLGGVPLIIFAIRGARIISQFFAQQSISVLTHNVQDKIYIFLDNFSEINGIDPLLAREKFDAFINQAASFILKTFSDLITQIPDLFLAGLVTILSFFFFLSKEKQLRILFDRYFYFSKHNSDRFIKVLKSSCSEVFFANVLTGIMQASIVSFGALASGIGDFYITFVMTFILSFIPVIGAAPMAFGLAIFAFFDDRVGAGVAMSIIGTVAGLADNLVRPFLVSLGEVEVPAFIGFLAVIGGVVAIGLPGLFVGPLLAALTYGAVPIVIDEYFPKVNQKSDDEQT